MILIEVFLYLRFLQKIMEFQEIQRFNKWWHWVIFITIIAIPIVSQFLAFNSIHYKDGAFAWQVFLILGLGALLWFSMCLTTGINAEGLSYRYFPFHWRTRRKNWDEIESIAVVEYSPLWHYGGWGLRFRAFDFSDILLNVSGKVGIRVVLKNGRKLMIGTQQKEEVERVLNYLCPLI